MQVEALRQGALGDELGQEGGGGELLTLKLQKGGVGSDHPKTL